MTRRPLVAGNWKMNKTPQETQEFIERFLARATLGSDIEVLLVPPFTSLDRAGRLLAESDVSLGAQDLHTAAAGAFTGAISAGMLAACGCAYVLVGHSERRHLFGDTDVDVNDKLRTALDRGLTPILCVGETLEERRADRADAVLLRQLDGGLDGVTSEEMAFVVIAYEPVWAIGTGETASPEQAQEAIAALRARLVSRFGEELANAVRILYGGSVKPGNARELQAQADIDGALIGGASLDPESLAHILDEARLAGQGDEAC